VVVGEVVSGFDVLQKIGAYCTYQIPPPFFDRLSARNYCVLHTSQVHCLPIHGTWCHSILTLFWQNSTVRTTTRAALRGRETVRRVGGFARRRSQPDDSGSAV
jgi:hypothetical protein